LSGHPAPRRQKGAGSASSAQCGFEVGGTLGPRVSRLTTDECINGAAIVATPCGLDDDGETARALTACHTATGRLDANEQTFVAFAQNQRDELRQVPVAGALAAEPGMKQQTYTAFSAKDHGADAQDNLSPTLRAGGHANSHANAGVMPAVAFNTLQDPIHGAVAQPLGFKGNGNGVLTTSAVRRLTPVECERLQGFPDNFTLVPYRGKPAADGPRYKALGNSMAVPVVRWIGERIEAVEALAADLEVAA
jgi:DNA (cytosine-5)-methyltransferase 1